ncbi:MAG: S1C family serine protease [Gammaproteobacteria bacterium]
MAKRIGAWVLFSIITISLFIGLIQLVYAQSSLTEASPPQSSAQKVYTRASNSIFTIYGVEPDGENKGVALGSAVAIDKNILATNCHVALTGTYLVVYINDTRKRGELYYYDQRNDLCLVKIPGIVFTPVNIRQSSTVSIGEEVFAIGNPKGYEKTISRGIISNKFTFKNTVILQTDAAISPGSSGGGLFDENGNLIGITFLKDESKGSEGLGFAIPTEFILAAMEQEKPSISEEQPTINQSIKQSNQVQSSSLTKSESNKNQPSNNITRIAYYGKSEIGLMRWQGKCFIAIVGRYKPDQPTSLAIWFPDNPNGFFIFSKIVNADDAVKFMIKMNQTNNTQYIPSKSFIFFNKKLHGISLISINNFHYPVYVFAVKSDVTETLVTFDYFLGQFYGYEHRPGMTTIKFDLDGFTEALAAYNKSCKEE